MLRVNPDPRTAGQSSAMIDRLLLISLLAILVAGCITVFSASSQYGLRSDGGPSVYFLSHLKKILMGLFVFLLGLKIDYRNWRHLGPILLGVCIVMMFMVNTTINEAERWLQIGPIQFQPSELTKFAVIIYLAGQLSRIKDFKEQAVQLLVAMIPILVVLVLLYRQPNYSMLMVISAVCGIMVLLAGLPLRWIAGAALAAVLGCAALLTQGDFHSARISSWWSTLFSPTSQVDQVMQSYIGFGRGGWRGVGPGESMQKYFYLPEPFNDFIFSIWGEEFGYAGCLLLLFAYAVIFWRGLNIVRRAPDDFGRMLAAGITGLVSVYTLINMMVTTGLMPVTGLPLPLFSYGGTAMITLLGSLGILMNVSYQSRKLDIGR